jgi:2-dehydro-3-deoxyglucarate aldolase
MKKKISYGSWLTIPHLYVLEIILNELKIKWVVIDLEHSSISYSNVEKLISTIHARKKLAFVRISEKSSIEIKKVLDAGADGLIIPMIKSKSDIKYVLDQSLFPPKGSRSYSLCKATNYGDNFQKYVKNFNKKIKIIPLIEHIDAVNNLGDILYTKKIDTIMVGPYDLSGSLNKPGDFTSQKFSQALKKIDIVCRKKKITKGIHIPIINPENLKKMLKNNFEFIAYGMDTQYLKDSIKKAFQKI